MKTIGSAMLLMAGVLLAPLVVTTAAKAANQSILVIVNDKPITSRDVNQRVKLNSALGYSRGSKEQRRKRALTTLIDEIIASGEARRRGVQFKRDQIDKTIENMAQGAGTSVSGLEGQLKKKGISMKTLRSQVEATMALRWIVGREMKTKVEVSDTELDRRYAKFTSDPRLKPVTVYQIREIDLPLGQVSEVMAQQLLQARAIEAQQIASKYKGCSSLKSASSGIYNVKVGRVIEAPSDKLPAKMKDVLRQAGTKKLIGPMRGPNGVRLIAYCGTRTIAPPKPNKEAVRNMLLNEKYEKMTDRVMRDLRRKAFIDYKDASARLTQ
jgi:peptidyl-prolyl cis-trans isomerase SurA